LSTPNVCGDDVFELAVADEFDLNDDVFDLDNDDKPDEINEDEAAAVVCDGAFTPVLLI